MSKHKNSHGIYDLTCISHKCSRRFKVLYDVRTVSRAEQIEKLSPQANTCNVWGYVQFTYPFTGCPFCGAWWCTGPLDGRAYPKVDQSELFPAFMRALNGRIMVAEAEVEEIGDLQRKL